MKNITRQLTAGLVVVVIGLFGWFSEQANAETRFVADSNPIVMSSWSSPSAVSSQQTIPTENTKNLYTIVVTSAGNGRISPDGSTTVKQGSVKSFDFLPDHGYRVAAIRVDGELSETVDSYTFMNISGDHSIEVVFSSDNESSQALTGSDVVTLNNANDLNTDGVISVFLW